MADIERTPSFSGAPPAEDQQDDDRFYRATGGPFFEEAYDRNCAAGDWNVLRQEWCSGVLGEIDD